MFCFGQIWLHTITVFTDFGCGVHKQCPEFSSNNALNVLRGIDMFWTLCKEQYKKYSDIGTTKVGIFQTPMDWIGQKSSRVTFGKAVMKCAAINLRKILYKSIAGANLL